ncbi:MAG: FAD-dependent oxidoreductase [Deltaproteobacteria bacterium]|nr:FAD-dependent oxidoreductase [Deltaproteobacteria bacterium]
MIAFKKLFSPIDIGSLHLKNRIVMPAMGTGYAAEDGSATERLIDYFVVRAAGGAALLIVEATAVHPRGRIFKGECGMFDDRHIPGFQRLTRAVHDSGGKIVMQLAHGGRQTKSALIGGQPLAPSPVPAPALCTDTPKEMTVDEIQVVVRSFGEAAQRAKEAGFDAVEIHGAHGYLINQFLSQNANLRTDGYGGGLKNRARLAIETVSEVKKSIGSALPLFFRLNGEDYIKGGSTLNEAVEIAPWLIQAGADVLHVSAGVYGSDPPTIPLIGSERGCFIPLAKAVKDVATVPVIAAGRIKSPLLAEKVLEQGAADLISMGRALMADPDLPKKVKSRKLEEIRPCVGCGQACIERLLGGIKKVENDPISCVVNPVMGREKEWLLHPASQLKRILVIGGGPGGIQAAIVAAQRGHEVVLCEKDNELGGNLRLAAMVPGREEFSEFLDYLIREINRSGVEVSLNREVHLKSLREINPDAVILATGASFQRVKVPGIDPERIFTAADIFTGKREISGHTVVLGANQIGLETALFLSNQGKRVTVIEEGDHFAPDMGPIGRFDLLNSLKKRGVEVLKQAGLIRSDNSQAEVLIKGKERSIKGDLSIVSVEQIVSNRLSEEIENTGFPCHVIGDALRPRKALEAIEEGYGAGMKI